MPEPLRALPLADLRRRSSTKWRTYPDDVLPMFVAEHDFPLAPGIAARLAEAVALGDTGYTPPRPGIVEAFAGFAHRRWGWEVAPERMRPTADVMMGVVEILRRVVAPGERVVVPTPVYQPFYDTVEEAGAVVERVPLRREPDGWRLDVPGIEAALAGGARAVLLCNPQNPTGTVHAREDLAALADAAERYGAHVVSDEIHGPLTQPGATFTPFLTASATAARIGYAVTSASKAFNLAGLKCAIMIGGSDDAAAVLRGMPSEVEWRTGLLGALASNEAFAPAGEEWLDALVAAIDVNRRLLADLLAEEVPEAVYLSPDASYLAWVDLTALGWGDHPAVRIRREGNVALQPGTVFGEEGRGFVRINIGCSPEVLTEAIRRIGRLRRGETVDRVLG